MKLNGVTLKDYQLMRRLLRGDEYVATDFSIDVKEAFESLFPKDGEADYILFSLFVNEDNFSLRDGFVSFRLPGVDDELLEELSISDTQLVWVRDTGDMIADDATQILSELCHDVMREEEEEMIQENEDFPGDE